MQENTMKKVMEVYHKNNGKCYTVDSIYPYVLNAGKIAGLAVAKCVGYVLKNI